MSRYSAGAKAAAIGTTVRAVGSLYAIANRSGILRQVNIFNSTNTAVVYRLVRHQAIIKSEF